VIYEKRRHDKEPICNARSGKAISATEVFKAASIAARISAGHVAKTGSRRGKLQRLWTFSWTKSADHRSRLRYRARATAIAFAREGADIVLNYLASEEKDAQEVVALIEAAGQKAVPIPGDISEESFCQTLVEKGRLALGGLDIVVNNAGKQQAQESIEDLTTEHFDQTFKTNVYALFWICKAALPHLPPGATIINTASIQAYEPSPTLLDYAPTKAAIVAFTKSLAKQVASKGIRVNAVAPGPVWTPLQSSGGQPPEKIPEFGAKMPLGRPAQPAELAPIYVVLASQESSYVTGEVYGVTGGNPLP